MSTLTAQCQPVLALPALRVGRAVDDRADVPPLEPGDRLTRDEFYRRYEAMPGVKAELIEGIVYMASPVRLVGHGYEQVLLATWLGVYHAATRDCVPGDNATTRLDLDNVPQPDLLLMVKPAVGGQAKLVDGYVEGSPELAIEVSSSSVSIDVHTKLHVYRRAGVREYLVWRVRDRAIDWYERSGSDFAKKTPADDGTLRSTVFPGLWLDVAALLAGDLANVIATLNAGTASPEHAAFVADLAAKASTPT